MNEILKHRVDKSVDLPNNVSVITVESPEGLSDISWNDLLNIYHRIEKIRSLKETFVPSHEHAESSALEYNQNRDTSIEYKGEAYRESPSETQIDVEREENIGSSNIGVVKSTSNNYGGAELEFERDEEAELETNRGGGYEIQEVPSVLPLGDEIDLIRKSHESAKEKLKKLKKESIFTKKETMSHKKTEKIESSGGESMNDEKHDIGLVIPYITKHEDVELPRPNLLDISPDERANVELSSIISSAKRYTEVNRTEIAGEVLRLTKELLKEKDPVKKAEIKEKIKQLKMLSMQSKRKEVDMLKLLIDHQKDEFNRYLSEFEETIQTYKDSIENSYSQAKSIATGEPQMLNVIESLHKKDDLKLKIEAVRLAKMYADYLIKLHIAELEKLKGMGDVNVNEVDARINEIRDMYEKKFNTVLKDLLSIGIDNEEVLKANLISIEEKERQKQAEEHVEETVESKQSEETPENLSQQIKEEHKLESQPETSEMENIEEKIIDEIKSMKTAQLLHYLSTRDKQAFRQYINGEIDRVTAEIIARRRIAKDRGISEDAINKYFPLS